jgi:hypothetical protein
LFVRLGCVPVVAKQVAAKSFEPLAQTAEPARSGFDILSSYKCPARTGRNQRDKYRASANHDRHPA